MSIDNCGSKPVIYNSLVGSVLTAVHKYDSCFGNFGLTFGINRGNVSLFTLFVVSKTVMIGMT